jgi:hypothetical protein
MTTSFLACICLFTAAPQAEVTLELRPVEGSKYTYSYRSESEFPGDSTSVFTATFLYEVSKSSNGKISISQLVTNPTLLIDGNELGGLPDSFPKVTIQFDKYGEVLMEGTTLSDDVPLRTLQAEVVTFPAKPIKPGDSWKRTHKASGNTPASDTAFKLEAMEKCQDLDCAKISIQFSESSQSSPMKVTGALWVERATGMLVKYDTNWQNVIWEEGIPAATHSKVTIVRQK